MTHAPDDARRRWESLQAKLPPAIRERIDARERAAALESIRDGCLTVVREFLRTLGLVGEVLWERRMAEQPPFAADSTEFRLAIGFDRAGLHDLSLAVELSEHGPYPAAWVVHHPAGEKRFELSELDAVLQRAATYHPTAPPRRGTR